MDHHSPKGRLFSMKKEIIVGIDVSKNFSYFSMIGPDDKQIGKQFKVNHTLDDLKAVAKKNERSRNKA
jgi:hypothetical protein